MTDATKQPNTAKETPETKHGCTKKLRARVAELEGVMQTIADSTCQTCSDECGCLVRLAASALKPSAVGERVDDVPPPPVWVCEHCCSPNHVLDLRCTNCHLPRSPDETSGNTTESDGCIHSSKSILYADTRGGIRLLICQVCGSFGTKIGPVIFWHRPDENEGSG